MAVVPLFHHPCAPRVAILTKNKGLLLVRLFQDNILGPCFSTGGNPGFGDRVPYTLKSLVIIIRILVPDWAARMTRNA